ncbi:MAG: hypothetical protein HY298_19050 [Verrucomicrobia bacterium]|nr:hypothetical protein [Verrucomicrobiota bacterium]
MKRLRLIGILAVVILMGCLVFDLALLREPSYQGRTLTQWLEPEPQPKRRNPFNTRFERDPKSPEVQRAIKAIGTNAIPTLLKMIQAKDSLLKTRLNSLLDRQTIIHLRFRSASVRRGMAWDGFAILAKEAKSAAPSLALLTKDSDVGVRVAARESLLRVTSDKELLVPVLLEACHDSASGREFFAAATLEHIAPQELEKLGIPGPLRSIHNQAKNNVETNEPATTK